MYFWLVVEPGNFWILGCEILKGVFIQVSILVHLLDQVFDFVGMVFRGVFLELTVVLLVCELPVSFGHVSFLAHDYSGRSFVCWFYDDVCASSE